MPNYSLNEIYLPYFNGENKRIWTYAPECAEGEKLPVIYMTDGQNLFDALPTRFGSWKVEKALEVEFSQCGKKAVIVGIDNGSTLRDNELTPGSIGGVISDEMENFTEPLGEKFDDFLINTVMPYAQSKLPVMSERGGSAVCGSSSGGLEAFFSALEHKDRFSYAGVFSPAFLIYSPESLRRYLESRMGGDMPYLYIYCGAGDPLEERIYKSVDCFGDLLAETGYPYEKSCQVILLENKHNEEAWSEIFPDFLHTFLSSV